MTKINSSWENAELDLEVDGHSSAESGEDNLVCAAVSILVQSMMTIFRLLTEKGFVESYTEIIRDGYVKFHVVPKDIRALQRIFDMTMVAGAGFELLAEAHPDKVCIGWGNKKSKCDNMKSRHSGETVLDAQERL